METVDFLSTESGGDLIVSFAIAAPFPGGIISLTLLRMTEYDFLLYPEERGVSVSREDAPASEGDMLDYLRWDGTTVRIVTREGRKYALDVRHVEEDNAQEAKRILRAMNADQAFTLELIDRPDGQSS